MKKVLVVILYIVAVAGVIIALNLGMIVATLLCDSPLAVQWKCNVYGLLTALVGLAIMGVLPLWLAKKISKSNKEEETHE